MASFRVGGIVGDIGKDVIEGWRGVGRTISVVDQWGKVETLCEIYILLVGKWR
jgi:hypothetical protein